MGVAGQGGSNFFCYHRNPLPTHLWAKLLAPPTAVAVFACQRSLGAIIHDALVPYSIGDKDIMNYGPYKFLENKAICEGATDIAVLASVAVRCRNSLLTTCRLTVLLLLVPTAIVLLGLLLRVLQALQTL